MNPNPTEKSMKEKCGCKVTVDPKTQFETVIPCEKHDTWKHFWVEIERECMEDCCVQRREFGFSKTTPTVESWRKEYRELVYEYNRGYKSSPIEFCIEKKMMNKLEQFISSQIQQAEERGYDDGVYACRIGEEKCPRHLSSLRCLDCIEELSIRTKEEKVPEEDPLTLY